MWFSGSGGLLDMKGNRIGDAPTSTNFLIWWDGDFSRELLDKNYIDKYKVGRIFYCRRFVLRTTEQNQHRL